MTSATDASRSLAGHQVILQAGNTSYELFDAEPTVVPASRIVIKLPGGTRRVKLDGEDRQPGHGLIALDLTRSTGFHRLVVDGRTFWFATEDAKLALTGIEAMLSHLRRYHAGAGWGGQILFSSGDVLRDPHVVFTWLDEHFEEIREEAMRILNRPLWGREPTHRLSRAGGSRVLTAATHRLLRGDPQRYLVEDEIGLLRVGDKCYTPLRVVSRHDRVTIRTAANLRLTALLNAVSRLILEVIDTCDAADIVARCIEWKSETAAILQKPLARELLRGGVPLGALYAPRAKDEVADRRYRRTYSVAQSLRQNFGWQADQAPANRYSYVDYADQIYQAFVGVVVADALGCSPTEAVLGRASREAFRSDELDVFLDRTPPTDVLKSWRHVSSTPDQLRPDLIIHKATDKKVLLIDAKYRSQGVRASEDSRKELLSYMASYGLDTAVIAYPPRDAQYDITTIVEGFGQRLIELPIAPRAGLEEKLATELPQLLQYLSPGRY